MRNRVLSSLSSGINAYSADAIRLNFVGQSNQNDAKYGTVPAEYQGLQTDVDGQGHNIYVMSLDTGNVFAIANTSVNTDNSLWGNMALEIPLARLVCQHYNKDVYITKVTEGGRPLAVWDNTSPYPEYHAERLHWDFNTSSTGEFCDLLIDYLVSGNTYFSNNNIKAYDLCLDYNQGEADARDSVPSGTEPLRYKTYESNLTAFYNKITPYLLNNTKWIHNYINANLTTISAASYIYRDNIRSSGMTVVSTTLMDGYDMTQHALGVDEIHYNVTEFITMADNKLALLI